MKRLFEASGMRDKDHYERMFANAATIGARLAAKSVYAARFGDVDLADPDLLREITRRLIARYGETLTAGQILAEMKATSDFAKLIE